MNNYYQFSPLSCIVFFVTVAYLIIMGQWTLHSQIPLVIYLDRTLFYLIVFLWIIDVVSQLSIKRYDRDYPDITFAAVSGILYFGYRIGLFQLQFISFKILISVLILIRSYVRAFFQSGNVSDDTGHRKERFVANAMNNPARTVLLGYLYLIFFGTILLTLPIAVRTPEPISFSDALFTASSASTITGLTTLDLLSTFSTFGLVVIVVLVQIGGLGVMIVSYFFGYIILRRKMKFQNKATISADTNNDGDTGNLSGTILHILVFTFSVEAVGAVLFFIRFFPDYGLSMKNVGYALFHGVTGFCNAGFFIYDASMATYIADLPLNLIFAGLIIIGGLGFPVCYDIVQYFIRWYRTNVMHRFVSYKGLSVNTKIVLIADGILLLAGTLLIYLFEHGTSMQDLNIGTQYLASFFQSVTMRTAGFNTVNLASLQVPTLFVMILLMFIGGASGSMAGGVKVNTLTILAVSLFSFLRGRSENVIMHKSISHSQVYKSFFIFFMSQVLVAVSMVILSYSNSVDFISVFFETVSAFSTTGAAIGITSSLNLFGKDLLIILMVLGKLGPMTVLMLLSREETPSNIRYPDVDILIG